MGDTLKIGQKVKVFNTDIVAVVSGISLSGSKPEYWITYTKDYVCYVEQWPPEWLEPIAGKCTCGARAVQAPGHSHWCDAN